MKPKREGKTDWERVRRESAAEAPIPYDPEDGPYDPNDEAAVEAYFATAIVRGPGRPKVESPRVMVSLRLEPEVRDALRATGPGWQTRVAALLKDAVKKGRL